MDAVLCIHHSEVGNCSISNLRSVDEVMQLRIFPFFKVHRSKAYVYCNSGKSEQRFL